MVKSLQKQKSSRESKAQARSKSALPSPRLQRSRTNEINERICSLEQYHSFTSSPSGLFKQLNRVLAPHEIALLRKTGAENDPLIFEAIELFNAMVVVPGEGPSVIDPRGVPYLKQLRWFFKQEETKKLFAALGAGIDCHPDRLLRSFNSPGAWQQSLLEGDMNS